MKTILTLKPMLVIGLLVSLVFSSCNVYEPGLRRGDDELVFQKSVRKLNKRPKNQKAIIALEKSYNRLVAKDLRAIELIKLDDDPSQYVNMFDIYDRLAYRQSKITHLVPLHIEKEHRSAQIELTDYNKELIAVKKKAAEYLYVSSERLLQTGTRHDSRVAFEQLLRLKEFYPRFRDVDALISQASLAGKSNVLLSVVNGSGHNISDPLFNSLTSVAIPQMQWANLHTNEFAVDRFDYVVNFVLEDLYVGPEMIKEKEYSQEAQIMIERPKRGPNGVVMRDSTGKTVMMQVPKMIYCDVTEVEQRKESWMKGRIEIVDAFTGNLVHSQSVHSSSKFVNRFAVASGNIDALTTETRRLLDGCSKTFWPNRTMLQNNINDIKRKLQSSVKDCRHLIL